MGFGSNFGSQIKKHDGHFVVIHLSNGEMLTGRIDGTTRDGAFFEFNPDGPNPRRTINTNQVVSIYRAGADIARTGRSRQDAE